MNPVSAGADLKSTNRSPYPISLDDLAQALDHSDEGFALTDPEGNYVYINEAHLRMYGYDRPQDLLGRTWRALYTEEWVRHFEEEVLPIIPRDKVWRGQVVGRRRDGSRFLAGITLTLLRDGKITCNCRHESGPRPTSTPSDNGQSALRELGERLIAGLPARFRQPLDLLSGYTAFFLSELEAGRQPSTDALRDGLGAIDATGRRLAEQMKRLDLVARLAAEDSLDRSSGAEAAPGCPWPTQLGRALRRRAAADQRGSDVTADLADAGLVIDYQALECIVLELLGNALQASRPGDAVRLTGGIREGSYVLKICDEGVGLPPDGLPAVAGRLLGQTAPAGFGLAVVQYILHRSGGTLARDAEGPGNTCLRLTLPLRD